MKMAILPILLLFAGIVIFVMRLRFARSPHATSPRLLHPAIRIACAVIGTGIVLTILFTTIRDAHHVYQTPEQDDTLAVPVAESPLTLADADTQDGSVRFAQAAIRATLLVVEPHDDTFYPLATKTMELNWPDDRGQKQSIDMKVDDTRYTLTISVHGFHDYGERLSLNASVDFRRQSPGRSSMSGSSGSAPLETVDVKGVSPRSGERPPFSAFSLAGRNQPERLALLYISAAADTAGFVPMPATEWLARHQDSIASSRAAMRERWTYSAPYNSPGMAFLAHFGPNSVLLMLAAICLAQLFKRRTLATAFTWLAMVVFAILLERAVFNIHRDMLTNGTDSERAIAAEALTRTFFFHQEAADLHADPPS